MKKIAIDLRSLESPTGKRGIGYYNRHLFLNLLSKPHPKISFNLITFPKSRLPVQFRVGPFDKFKNIPALFWPKKGLRRFDSIFSIFWSHSLKKIKPELIHIPSLFEIYYLYVPDNVKSIVTLYDVIPLIYPDKYFQNEKAKDWYLMRLNQAKKASKIITISKSSKKDIAKILNISSEKIEVIYGGVDKRFKLMGKDDVEKILNIYNIKMPYILTVSTHSFHKNILSIFQAFKNYIRLKNNNLTLVVVCKLEIFEEKDWRGQLKKLGIEDRVILTNFVSDEELAVIYNGAKLFLFPSLYEGLGLPVLEAFACGTPVITSNVSSLPEVGGDAVLYVDPQNVGDITAGISKILSDENLRRRLIEKGFSQVKKFTWSLAADKTLRVYKEVLGL